MTFFRTFHAANVVKDAIRPEAVASIQKLKGMGYSCGMVGTTLHPHVLLLTMKYSDLSAYISLQGILKKLLIEYRCAYKFPF